MKRSSAPAPILIAIASMITLTLVAFTAAPAGAIEPWRAKAAEDVAVRLTKCIRSGGHVTRAGKCRGWGKGIYAKRLPDIKRSRKISNKVSVPWAKRSVKWQGTRSCWIGHSKNGSTVDKRFAAASLKHIANGENMGCGLYGSGKTTVIRIVRMWQAEKSYNGPHWRQIRDRDFKSFGVGVARYGKRKSQIVVNFYGKLVP
ncbi:MAG: CAP domain-containing protein [Candidatus Limnocylindrales bacterium]